MELWGLNIGIKDIVDIAIVSYVVYKLMMLIRGTRAVQLLRGVFLVLLAWAFSTWFQLNTLKWMMDQMITFGVLAIIIIFQPELRRALEQLGRGKLFGRTSEEDQATRKIGDVIRAVHYLAKRKIGALIVFERETGLNEYIESGTTLQSQISTELIVNLFIPNTPLHDGAVIIRGSQLMAAGCYLPLSENPFISKELGTRHRAAIGMSEVSDAICVVVSEETGQVSLVMNGQIVRDVDEESLISKLHEQLKPANKAKERQPFWRRRNGHDG
ncbi:diadenylate cyclase CdaA [Paenibacillus thermoaerophilus]|uniref:Diadenylate cyclase n=1 Tax=Paenibacillus thermoaerophilus TaxID=1215385 RepID=A0ABW2V302_9BACL|nr:diadenylate cyclase CdaA [Paenibacillus thermoaerophilus]TMV18141.1 TIGR00159 family protein [Paenibacillus thermoaerophilus]